MDEVGCQQLLTRSQKMHVDRSQSCLGLSVFQAVVAIFAVMSSFRLRAGSRQHRSSIIAIYKEEDEDRNCKNEYYAHLVQLHG